jgi:hypothetical protein
MVKYPEIKVQLTGTDGNAFAIMSLVKKGLRKGNVSAEEIDAYLEQSMSGDYDNLIATACEWVTVS